MQRDNSNHMASIHDLPTTGQPGKPPAIPGKPPAISEPPATLERVAAPANGTKRASVFAPAWNTLRSAGWFKRITDSPTVQAFLSTVRKALDDTQAGSQHDDKKRP